MPYAVCRRPVTERQQSRDREGAGRHTAYGIRLAAYGCGTAKRH
ncbi:MAG: hypothetical protein ACR2L2_00195 [Acidobacteriota bacterium]